MFVGAVVPTKQELSEAPWLLRVLGVRRTVVCRALQWLKRNNPLYAHVQIDEDELAGLSDGVDSQGVVPPGLLDAAFISQDVKAPAREQSSYVQTPDNPASRRVAAAETGSVLAETKRADAEFASAAPVLPQVDSDVEMRPASAVSSSPGAVSAVPASSAAATGLPADGVRKEAAKVPDEVPLSSSGVLDANGCGVSSQAIHSAALQKTLRRSAADRKSTRLNSSHT